MPSYTYKCTNNECTKLNEEFDVTKRISDPTPSCNECSSTLHQVFTSAASFTLKGKGWTGSNIARRG
jgi:putative FmdB family regulatory protein